MEEKKRTAPVVQNGSGQMRLDGFPEDLITSFEAQQGSIAFFLNRGRANAISCRELETITGLPQRQITRKICAERRQGSPILSDTSGFWIAADEDELIRCVQALHARAGEIYRTANALEQIGGG